MVKLSDALRGAADRAPLEGISVDTRRAARRTATQRGLRSGAGGLLGVGMIAVVAAGLAGPGASLASSAADDGRDMADAAGGGAMEGALPEAGTSLAWGLCGQPLPGLPEIAGPVTLTASLPSEEAAGDALPVDVTTVAIADGSFETFGLDGVILWDGIVVATIDGAPGDGVARELTVVDLVAGDETTTQVSFPLVNCWDGSPLPASKYELVVSQEFWAAAVEEPPAEPPTEPSTGPVEPTVAPEPDEPIQDPADSPGVTDGATGSAASSGMAVPDAGPVDEMAVEGSELTTASIAAGGFSARIAASPVAFVVPGEPVANPFAAYLEPAPEPEPTIPDQPPVPDGALDPATARELYRDGLTGSWDMAAGSQRWIASSDSAAGTESQWYGCAYDGDGAFPARSSVMDLLDVRVDAPSAIDVSYGWIVEDNPRITSRLTNTSEWDLAGFWGKDSLQLALVRDGRVVAEAYAVNPEQNRIAYAEDTAAAAEADAAAGTSSVAIYPAPDTTLPSGASAETLFLWRDVNTCWTSTGQPELEPGSYTLLAMHYLSVGGGYLVMDGTNEDLARGSLDSSLPSELVEPGDEGSGSALGSVGAAPDGASVLGGTAVEPDVAIAPAPDAYDAIEFQVWTSLGRVQVR